MGIFKLIVQLFGFFAWPGPAGSSSSLFQRCELGSSSDEKSWDKQELKEEKMKKEAKFEDKAPKKSRKTKAEKEEKVEKREESEEEDEPPKKNRLRRTSSNMMKWPPHLWQG